jgi:phage I-like protein
MKLNTVAVAHLRSLIQAGHVNRSGTWAFVTADGNAFLGRERSDWGAYGAVHLGIDPAAGNNTKARFHYPAAKLSGGRETVYLSGLRAAITRAFQSGDIDIAHAAQRLLTQAKPQQPAATSVVIAAAIMADLPASITDGESGESEIQLFPDGEFTARDGRPGNMTDAKGQPLGLQHWVMNATVARRLIGQAEARKTPYVIDYEHQSLHAEKNGQPAPAAGWFKTLVYRPGQGLFARVEWTDRARRMVAAREYRFISPLFVFDRQSGEPQALLNASLSNNPAIDGMDDVAQRAAAVFDFTYYKETTVNWKDTLIKLFGLEADADDAVVEAALTALNTRAVEGESALHERDAQIAALTEHGTGAPDPAKFVSIAVAEDLRTQIADLASKQTEREVEEVLAAAMSDERGPLLLDAQIPWARELGKTDLVALQAYLKTATPLAALRGRQTAGRKIPDGAAQTFDAEQRAVLTTLGLSAEDINAMSKEGA